MTMATLLPTIDDFGTRLSAASSFDAALDLLATEVQQLGFDGVDYAYLPSTRLVDGGWVRGPVFARNFPPRWQVGWARYGCHDPILPWCFRRGLPVDWQSAKQELTLTAAQRTAISFLEWDMGFPGGITIPIHLPGDRFAFVSGVSTLRDAAWQALSKQATAPLMVLAHTFHHLAGARCPAAGNDASMHLTRRELQCLRLVATGYTAPAVARTLHRSTETVRGHLKRAMAKLGARTIAHCVAIAAGSGLLELPAHPTQSTRVQTIDPIG